MRLIEGFTVHSRIGDVPSTPEEDSDPGSALGFLRASKENPPGDKVLDLRGSLGGSIIGLLEALGFRRK